MRNLWVINLMTAALAAILIIYGPIWYIQVAGWAILIFAAGLGVYNFANRKNY